MTTRLLIVDDDPEIASALVRGLGRHGYEAEAAHRADIALDRLASGAFDAAIVDVMLGEDSGLDLVRAARAKGIDAPLLMLSAQAEVEDRAAGLAAGADDYVVKPFSFDELIARLRVQELRARSQRPEPAALSPETGRVSRGASHVDLTGRETELLALLARNADAPLSRAAIFDALWAGDGSASENVVDVYIGYLRRKLARDVFGFEIRTLRNQGFMLDGCVPRVREG